MQEFFQKKWLQYLNQAMANETALSRLYARYAELFPEQAETWNVLARAETKHAALLQGLLDLGTPAVEEIPLDKLQSGPMDFITGQIKVMREKAVSGEVMPTRAIANALLLESSMAENFLFSTIPYGESPFRLVAEQLHRESEYHRKLVLRLQTGESGSTDLPSAPDELTPEAMKTQVFQARPAAPEPPPCPTGNSIAKQAVIGAMARHEETVAQLYRKYAELFPELAEFWNTLAAEEIAHANTLRSLGVRIQNGELDFSPDRLDLETIRVSSAFLDNQLVIARRDPIKAAMALDIAWAIEEKTIEVQAFNVFTEESTSPQLRAAFAALREQEVRHRELIDQMIKKGPGPYKKGFFARLFGGK